MTTDTDQNPTPTDPAEQREITVSIPADRVESFERLVQRFLGAGERHGRGCAGKHRGPRGRGRHVHVHIHG